MAKLLLAGAEHEAMERLGAALGRSLGDWDLQLIHESEAALEELSRRRNHYDLILARFDATTLARLLEVCRTLSPQTLRFAACEAAEPGPGSIPFAHQRLAPNVSPAYIVELLQAAAEVAATAQSHPVLAQLITDLSDVPSPPLLYFDIREQIEGHTGSSAGMAEIAARDPSLVARILRVANSGFYGVPRSISSLEEAVRIIGTDSLLSMVLAAHLFSGLPPPGLNLEVLWRHALQVSALAREIATLEGASIEEQGQAFIAGLLHDIGIMVLLENQPARYQPMWQQAAGDEQRLAVLEREAFGTTHGELGALILKLWSLPEAVVEGVRHSHSELVPKGGGISGPAEAVMAAEWLLGTPADAATLALHNIDPAVLAAWEQARANVLRQDLVL